jgi:uncharacterized repeat protein (TIGR01451 family)
MRKELRHKWRHIAALAAVALIPAASASAGAHRAAPVRHLASTITWNLGDDLQANATSSAPSNPFADSHGNAGVWHMMEASSTTRDPSTYSDIPPANFEPNHCGQPGYANWCDNAFTFINTTSATINGTPCAPSQVLSPHAAVEHPGPANDVMYAWQSPITGTVAISGGVSDVDCGGGNGVNWYVAKGATDIDSGSVFCSSTSFTPGLTTSVSAGEFLYFIVDPNGEFQYDSTQIDVTLTATPAPPSSASLLGKIVYGVDSSPGSIRAVNPDGSGDTQVIALSGSETLDGIAEYPDGSRIVYGVYTPLTGDDLYTANADGTGSTLLLANGAQPSVGPDGVVVFVRAGDLYKLDGGVVTRLTTTGGSNPDVSPDGTTVAYPNQSDSLTTVDMGGGTPIAVPTGGVATWAAPPSWSPDGSKLAFAGENAPNDVFVVPAGGGTAVDLTNDASTVHDNDPAWSPDGTRIAFVSNRGTGGSRSLWVMNADGTGATRIVTASGAHLTRPIWKDSVTQWLLSVSKAGTGTGAVSSSPAGISCGGTCSASFADGTSVTLTATADSTSTFAGWSGCATVSGTSCTVMMNAGHTVTASFSAAAPAGTTTTTTTPRADLAVAGSGPPVAAPGAQFAITYTITNNGPDDAHGVLVLAPIPAGATFVSATASQGVCTGGTELTCTLGALANSGSATITLTLVAPTTATTITVKATASVDETDANATNQSATVSVPTGCAHQISLDAVTVLADCVSLQVDGTYLADGNARFSNGAMIRVDGTASPAALVIDTVAHSISLQPGVSGQLVAGGRAVGTGTFQIDTIAIADATSALSGLARVNGLSHAQVELSGWGFADDAAHTSLFLVPAGSGGGALLDGSLKLPIFAGESITGTLGVQVDANGHRLVLTGGVDYNYYLLGNSNWRIQQIELNFSDGGDSFTGHGVFTAPFLGNLQVKNVVVKNGKVNSFSAAYDGTKCSACSVTDPVIGAVLKLKYAQLQGLNLSGISYAPPPTTSTPFSTVQTGCVPTHPCPPPAQITGTVMLTALENKVVAVGSFTDYLSGKFHAEGRIFFAPAIPSTFTFPAFAQGLGPYVQFARTGMDVASGSLDFTPPHRFVVRGNWIVLPNIDLLVGGFALGFDPPHWTGIGTLTLKVPSQSPIFSGKKVAGVEGLISDKAAAADATFKVCAPRWLGGGCISTDLSVAYLWSCSCFRFFDNINSYATVQGVTSVRRAAGVGPPSLRIPAGWHLASVRVTSANGVPDVRLTSPDVNGHRLELSAATSSEPGNDSGALVSISDNRHEEVFLVAEPPAGSWQVTRISGPPVAKVELASGGPSPQLVPGDADLEPRPLSRLGSLALHWSSSAVADGTVDIWASQSTDGQGGAMLAQDLPATGSTTVSLKGLTGGAWHVFGVLSQNGAPVATEYWPGSLQVTDPAAPAAPGAGSAKVVPRGVFARWKPTGARVYVVTAKPVPADAGKPLEFSSARASTLVHLRTGLVWDLSVQAVDAHGRRSTAAALGRVRLLRGKNPPPFVAGVPPPWAQVGQLWAFSPRIGSLSHRPVRLALAVGPPGMRLRDGALVWRPASIHDHPYRFTLRATSAGVSTTRTYTVSVAGRGVVLPAPSTGLALEPWAVPTSGGTVVVRAASLPQGTSIFVDGREATATLNGDGELQLATGCLAPGAHTVTIERPNGSKQSAIHALVALGRACH